MCSWVDVGVTGIYLFLPTVTHIKPVLRRFWHDQTGQDLIEYGLLASVIAIAGVLIWPQIEALMDDVFIGWETPVNDIWVPDDPGT